MFTVACCYWWLARVSVCLVGSATEHLSRLSRVSFFVQRVMHVRNGTGDGIPGLLYRPRTCLRDDSSYTGYPCSNLEKF